MATTAWYVFHHVLHTWAHVQAGWMLASEDMLPELGYASRIRYILKDYRVPGGSVMFDRFTSHDRPLQDGNISLGNAEQEGPHACQMGKGNCVKRITNLPYCNTSLHMLG